MATIEKVTNKSGAVKFRAVIRLKLLNGKRVTKTWDTKPEAIAWAAQEEVRIKSPAPDCKTVLFTAALLAYKKAVVDYRDHKNVVRDTSKINVLCSLLPTITLHEINPDMIASYVQRRMAGTLSATTDDGPKTFKPAKWGTVKKDLAMIEGALKYARLKLKLPIDRDAIKDGLTLYDIDCKGEKRTSPHRCRRASESEGALIEQQTCRHGIIAQFAIETAMRRGEMQRLAVRDLTNRLLTIRKSKTDAKTGKTGRTIPLSARAVELFNQMAEVCENENQLLGYANENSLTQGWIDLRTKLAKIEPSIIDLRLHDLRREGTCRLFKKGLTIEKVAVITGHSSWESLQIYTELRAEDFVDEVN